MLRLKQDFTNAWNAAARALDAIVVFWLSVAIELLSFLVHGLDGLRSWIEVGHPLPQWMEWARFGKRSQ